MTITPSYVGEPECNGVIERFCQLAISVRALLCDLQGDVEDRQAGAEVMRFGHALSEAAALNGGRA